MAAKIEDDVVQPKIEDDGFDDEFDRDHRRYAILYEENGQRLGQHRHHPIVINEDDNEAVEVELEAEIAEFIRLEDSPTPELPNLPSRNERIRLENILPRYERNGSV
jgi:hypothetical protein